MLMRRHQKSIRQSNRRFKQTMLIRRHQKSDRRFMQTALIKYSQKNIRNNAIAVTAEEG